MEGDIQYVGLNIVCVGGDGRCADLRSDVKWCLIREAGHNPSPIGFVPGLPSYWPRSTPILPERGLHFAPLLRCRDFLMYVPEWMCT